MILSGSNIFEEEREEEEGNYFLYTLSEGSNKEIALIKMTLTFCIEEDGD